MTTDMNQAWVLHKIWTGETSARVTFLTAEQGLVTGLYKGGRKPEKQALLQPFIPLWLVLKNTWVQNLESAASGIPLEGAALFSGLYINELLYRLLKTDAQPQLFDAYLATLRGLAITQTREEIEVLLRRFEWTLLKITGYAFSLTEEAQTGTPIFPDKHYIFRPGSGFYPISQGLSGAHILAISQDRLENHETLRIAKYIMRQAIDHLLGGVAIHTRKLYNPASP